MNSVGIVHTDVKRCQNFVPCGIGVIWCLGFSFLREHKLKGVLWLSFHSAHFFITPSKYQIYMENLITFNFYLDEEIPRHYIIGKTYFCVVSFWLYVKLFSQLNSAKENTTRKSWIKTLRKLQGRGKRDYKTAWNSYLKVNWMSEVHYGNLGKTDISQQWVYHEKKWR